MSTYTQDLPIAQYESGPETQPYMPGIGSGYLEPQHTGVDVGLAAGSAVLLPATGTFQEALSNTYESVFQLLNGGYEALLHIVPIHFSNNQLVTAGSQVGTVSDLTGTNFSVLDYSGKNVGSYTSTAPHLHIAEYAPGYGTQAELGSVQGSMDPTGLLGQSAQSSAPPAQSSNPVASWLTAIGSTVGGVASGIDNAGAGVISGAQQAVNGVTGIGDTASSVGSSLHDAQQGWQDLQNIYGFFTSPQTPQRLLFFALAFILLIVGLAVLFHKPAVQVIGSVK